MAVQIGARPDSGFDDPLGMLGDCHRRIEHFLEILGAVAGRAQGRRLTDEEVAAVRSAIHYFHVGGRRHTADEEESLFPRLLAAGGFAELEQLESEHGQAGDLHAEAEALYVEWISAGSLSAGPASRLLSATARLREIYQGHIQLEDRVVFPRAAQTLDSAAIAAMGREFRARRQ